MGSSIWKVCSSINEHQWPLGAAKKEIGVIILDSDAHHVFLLLLNGLSGIQAGAK